MSALTVSEAGLRVVNDSELLSRGQAIKQRRLALGLTSVRVFADAAGIDREALGKAEKGLGSSGTYDRAEAWLSREEVENGHDDPQPAPAVRVTLHDVYGIGEVIFDGATSPDELAAYVRALMAEVRPGSVDSPGEN